MFVQTGHLHRSDVLCFVFRPTSTDWHSSSDSRFDTYKRLKLRPLKSGVGHYLPKLLLNESLKISPIVNRLERRKVYVQTVYTLCSKRFTSISKATKLSLLNCRKIIDGHNLKCMYSNKMWATKQSRKAFETSSMIWNSVYPSIYVNSKLNKKDRWGSGKPRPPTKNSYGTSRLMW